ncbi:MAG TPA: HAD-IA family hydrolase [Gemmatimonadales bacterium]
MDNSVRAVLWDLDGTLVDSAEQHWRSWREALDAEGVVVTRAMFQRSFGQRNDVILGAWLGDAAAPERVRRLGEEKEVCYRRLVHEHGITALPGASTWVRALGAAGWRQAIASSAPRLNVEVVLEALGYETHFGTLVAAEDVRRGKPEPEVFLTAARRLAVPPARCVVVEDAEAGIEAARRAGMSSIAVGGIDAGADVVIGSLEDLPADAFARLVVDG